jgi:cysteine desulfurase/selenocysteine lyase
VQALGADFYAFSGHKVFGPTGIGALYARRGLLDGSRPWQFGGHMVSTASFDGTTSRDTPARFEAGTGHIAGAVGLAAAIDYLAAFDPALIRAHEQMLTTYALEALARVDGLRLIGNTDERIGVVSFVIKGWPPEVVGEALDRSGIAVRAGNHWAQPALSRLGYDSSIRASLALYNTCDDIDALASSLQRLVATGPS